MKIKLSLLIFTMFIAFSCKEENKEIATKTTNSEIIDLVNNWNSWHNKNDLSKLSNLYAENVHYYGTNLDRNEIIKDKASLFNKYKDFSQIVSDEGLRITDNSESKNILFIKKVSFNTNQKDYPSYLRVSKINGTWKIIKESDEITDVNLSKKDSTINDTVKAGSKINNDNRLYGDFNGDGTKEYAWIIGPNLPNPENYDDWDEEYDHRSDYCIGGCNSVVYFTDKQIVPITVFKTYGGMLVNLGDLNNNGTEEIGIWTRGYMTGSSSSLNIFDTKNFRKTLIEPFSLNFSLHDYAIKDAVKKLEGNKIEITESIYTDKGTYELRKRTVVVK